MKERNLHESLVLHVTAGASILSLAKVKDCFDDEHQRWLMNIVVRPPRLLLLQARSVRKHIKPGGGTSVLSISAFSHVSVTAAAHKFLVILDFARLLRSSDLLKIFSAAALHRPAIQPCRFWISMDTSGYCVSRNRRKTFKRYG